MAGAVHVAPRLELVDIHVEVLYVDSRCMLTSTPSPRCTITCSSHEYGALGAATTTSLPQVAPLSVEVTSVAVYGTLPLTEPKSGSMRVPLSNRIIGPAGAVLAVRLDVMVTTEPHVAPLSRLVMTFVVCGIVTVA